MAELIPSIHSVVREAIKQLDEKLGERLREPPQPLMSQEEFDALPFIEKAILTCNVPGCGKVVSTHHMLCVEHRTEQMNEES